MLISGLYHSWQRLTGPNLLSLTKNMVHVHGPDINNYFGQICREDVQNPSLSYFYVLTQRHLRKYGYAPDWIPRTVIVDIMHDLLDLLLVTESLHSQQVIPDDDWCLFKQFFDHWKEHVMLHGMSEWADQQQRVKAMVRIIIITLNHKAKMYRECKRIVSQVPIQQLDSLPQYIREHFTISTEWGHVHLHESSEAPVLSQSEDEDSSEESHSAQDTHFIVSDNRGNLH